MVSAKEDDMLLSLHLKATIMFDHVVKHAALFAKMGVNANKGLGDTKDKMLGYAQLAGGGGGGQRGGYARQPRLAMVDSRVRFCLRLISTSS